MTKILAVSAFHLVLAGRIERLDIMNPDSVALATRIKVTSNRSSQFVPIIRLHLVIDHDQFLARRHASSRAKSRS